MKIWNRYAAVYDLVEQLFPYQRLQDIAVEKLQLISHLNILDVGCGTGNTMLRICQKREGKTTITGIDSSSEMLERARKKIKGLQNVSVSLCEIDRYGEGKMEIYDRIISVNNLYATKNPNRVIGQWHRLLEDGGILVVANPFAPRLAMIFAEHFKIVWRERKWGGLAPFIRLFPQWILFCAINLRIARLSRGKTFHFLPPEELEETLRKAGFKILSKEILYGDTVALFSCQKESGKTIRRAQTPDEIASTFSLRYEVYCNELQSLNSENYPDKIERDKFDEHAVHFIVRDETSITGCIRLIPDGEKGFLFEEFFSFPEEYAAYRNRTVEFSRWIVAPRVRKSRLSFDLLEETMVWGKKRHYRFLVGVCRKELWDSIARHSGARNWEVVTPTTGRYREYHGTLSAPGILTPYSLCQSEEALQSK